MIEIRPVDKSLVDRITIALQSTSTLAKSIEVINVILSFLESELVRECDNKYDIVLSTMPENMEPFGGIIIPCFIASQGERHSGLGAIRFAGDVGFVSWSKLPFLIRAYLVLVKNDFIHAMNETKKRGVEVTIV